MSDRIRRYTSQQATVPGWVRPTLGFAIVTGIACWLLPHQIVRGLYKSGLMPGPREADELGGLARLADAIGMIRKVETLGAILAIGGTVLAVALWLRSQRNTPQRVIHEHIERDAPRRRRRPGSQTIPDATYVVEEDGEERIVPRKRRGSSASRDRTGKRKPRLGG